MQPGSFVSPKPSFSHGLNTDSTQILNAQPFLEKRDDNDGPTNETWIRLRIENPCLIRVQSVAKFWFRPQAGLGVLLLSWFLSHRMAKAETCDQILPV